MQPGDLYYAYFYGWRDGAGIRARQVRFTAHENVQIREAYETGYMGGRHARGEAMSRASTRYGYVPSILRAQS